MQKTELPPNPTEKVPDFSKTSRHFRGGRALGLFIGTVVATDAIVFEAHVISGLLAALAAVLWASMIGSCAPETGDSWLIGSFAVSIIGGTGRNGGVISIAGIFLGGAIFVLINYGLFEIKANPYFANSFLAIVLVFCLINNYT